LRNIGQIRGVKCYTISLDKAEEKEEKNIRKSPWYKHQIVELMYVAIFNMIVISLLIYHLKSNADFMEYILGAIVPILTPVFYSVINKYWSL
jgi:hypothetical protein